MKTLFSAILLFIFISIVWHASPISDWHIHLDGRWHDYEWMAANAIVIGVVFVAVALAIIIFVSLFAGVLFFVGLLCAAMVLVGLSFSWPVVFVAIVLYWLFSESKSDTYEN